MFGKNVILTQFCQFELYDAPANQTSDRSFNLSPSSTPSCGPLIIWSLRGRALEEISWLGALLNNNASHLQPGRRRLSGHLRLSCRKGCVFSRTFNWLWLGLFQQCAEFNTFNSTTSTYFNRFRFQCDCFSIFHTAPLNHFFSCLSTDRMNATLAST